MQLPDIGQAIQNGWQWLTDLANTPITYQVQANHQPTFINWTVPLAVVALLAVIIALLVAALVEMLLQRREWATYDRQHAATMAYIDATFGPLDTADTAEE